MRVIPHLAFLAIGFFFCLQGFSQTFTWNGSSSSNWATSTNWTPNGVPGIGSTVLINNNAVPNVCTLDADRTVATLTVSAGTLNLGTRVLTVTGNATFSGGTTQNGEVSAANLSNISAATFTGSVTLRKTGGGNNDLTGGNSFQNLTVINQSGSRIRFAATTGDSFSGTVTLSNSSTSSIQVAYNGSSSFANNITINNTFGTISFGAGAGTSSLSAGGALLTTGFGGGILLLNGFTQLGNSPNGDFTPTSFSATNSTLGGNISLVCAGDVTLNGASFTASVVLTGDDVNVTNANTFSSVSGSTTITKTGGANNDWTGGNTFGNVNVINQSFNRIRLATVSGDVFQGSALFNNTSIGSIQIAHNGATSFTGNVTVNNGSFGTVSFGGGTGTVSIASGSAILTTGFASGTFVLNRITQAGNAANGNFTPTSFSADGTSLNGNFSVVCSGDVTINSSSFTATNTFTGDDVNINNANNFSTVSGSTTITKTGGANNDWTGGNTFGNVVVNNQSAFGRIRLAVTNGDTYNGTATFNNSSINVIQIAHNGSSTFNNHVTVNNSTVGTISFGGGTGTSAQASGFGILTTGFSDGTLVINGFSQAGSVANGNFTPTTFTAANSTLRGNISVICTGDITISSCSFTASNTFAGDDININNANNFSTVAGATTFTKTGGGNNDWSGGNTFGDVTVNNQSSFGRIRLANTSGDTFSGSAVFNNTGLNNINIAHNASCSFARSVTVNNNSVGAITFGGGTGSATLAAGYGLLTTGFTNGTLTVNNFIQSGNTANGNFTPATFNASATTLTGNISVICTGDITISSSSFTAANTFTGDDVNVNNANNFSTVGGTTVITKTGGGNNDWTGGNVFGDVTVINQSNTGRIRMANTSADDFNGTATFNQTGLGLLQPAYNATCTFAGDISTTGTTTAITFGSGTGRVTIDGSVNRSILGSSAFKPVFTRFTMATNGNVLLTLNVPVDISTNLTMTSGRINTTSTNIINLVDETVTANVGNASAYVNGPMQYVMSTNSGTRSTLNFPIGKSLDWRPAVLQVAHNQNTSYTYRAEVFNTSAEALGWTKPATITVVSSIHYWDIDRFVTSTMASSPSTDLRTTATDRPIITLYYDTNDGVTDPTNLRICKNTSGATTTWVDIGGSGATVSAGSVTSTSSPTLFNSFSRFTIGNFTGGSNPLPVELVDFKAIVEDRKVNLKWSTASEINNDFFAVERSANGVRWQEIAKVKGNGNSKVTLHYKSSDDFPLPGRNYYRLKQTDFDGQFEYSNVVMVEIKGFDEGDIHAYPNPTSDWVTVTGDRDELKSIKVFDTIGNSIIVPLSKNERNDIVLDFSLLKPGVYVLCTAHKRIKILRY